MTRSASAMSELVGRLGAAAAPSGAVVSPESRAGVDVLGCSGISRGLGAGIGDGENSGERALESFVPRSGCVVSGTVFTVVSLSEYSVKVPRLGVVLAVSVLSLDTVSGTTGTTLVTNAVVRSPQEPVTVTCGNCGYKRGFRIISTSLSDCVSSGIGLTTTGLLSLLNSWYACLWAAVATSRNCSEVVALVVRIGAVDRVFLRGTMYNCLLIVLRVNPSRRHCWVDTLLTNDFWWGRHAVNFGCHALVFAGGAA